MSSEARRVARIRASSVRRRHCPTAHHVPTMACVRPFTWTPLTFVSDCGYIPPTAIVLRSYQFSAIDMACLFPNRESPGWLCGELSWRRRQKGQTDRAAIRWVSKAFAITKCALNQAYCFRYLVYCTTSSPRDGMPLN